MAQISQDKIVEILNRGKVGRILTEKSREKALALFEPAKEKMIQQFEEHEVSKEIRAGPDAPDSSFTNGYGNLFSLIGFDKDADPVGQASAIIQQETKLGKGKQGARRGFIIPYLYKIESPIEKLEKETLFPGSYSTKSWLFQIERGLFGFNYYLQSFRRRFSGRSGSAIQVKTKIRSGQVRGISYFTKIYNNFLKQTRGKSQ